MTCTGRVHFPAACSTIAVGHLFMKQCLKVGQTHSLEVVVWAGENNDAERVWKKRENIHDYKLFSPWQISKVNHYFWLTFYDGGFCTIVLLHIFSWSSVLIYQIHLLPKMSDMCRHHRVKKILWLRIIYFTQIHVYQW